MADLDCLLTSFEAARMQLVSSDTQKTLLVGRETQQQELQQTLENFCADSSGPRGGMFVSGAAGTGKTLTVQTFLRSYYEREESAGHLIEINAQQLQSAQMTLASVTRKLLEQRRDRLRKRPARTVAEKVDEMNFQKELTNVCRLAKGEANNVEFQQRFRELWNLMPRRAGGGGRRKQEADTPDSDVLPPLQLVFIDEIDCLCSSREGLSKKSVASKQGEVVVAQLYRLALQPNSNMILIGCSNYTQLGAYLTSVLKHKTSSTTRSPSPSSPGISSPTPQPSSACLLSVFSTLTFQAYSSSELLAILTTKLSGSARVHTTALRHIAQDVHGTTGDCREAVSKLGKTLAKRIGDIRALMSKTDDYPLVVSRRTPPWLSLADLSEGVDREEDQKNGHVPKTTTTAAPPTPAGDLAVEEEDEEDSQTTQEGEDDSEILYVQHDESHCTPLPSPHKKQMVTPLRRSPRLSPSSLSSPTTAVETPVNEWAERMQEMLLLQADEATPRRVNVNKRKLQLDDEGGEEENIGNRANVRQVSTLIDPSLYCVDANATTSGSHQSTVNNSVVGKLEEILGQLTPTDLMILYCLCTLEKRKRKTNNNQGNNNQGNNNQNRSQNNMVTSRSAKRLKGMVGRPAVRGMRKVNREEPQGSFIRVMELQEELKALFRQLDPAGVLYPASTKSIQDAALTALGSHAIVKVESKSEEIFLLRSADDLYQTKFMQTISAKLCFF
eukprot:GHVS01050759.1.p1 GENE.GHVS01050759.1~~GHVS01050759.1.p1  ORF type:complete len:765 (-),score=149.35 GHVS01050759.1:849-3026(-)